MTDQQGQQSGHDLGELGGVILQGAKPDLGLSPVTLADIFSLLQKGGTKYIRRENPGIRADTIALGRAWLIATRPDLYDRDIAPGQVGDMRMLIDECLSARIIPMVRNGFGYATHVNFVGLSGRGDSGPGDREVWEWAVNNRIDAIITRDRRENRPDKDLTRIAKDHTIAMIGRMEQEKREIVDLAGLPVIIHVLSGRNDYRHVSGLFNRNKAKIYEHLQTRTAPVISVTDKGVSVPVTYQSLWNTYQQEQALQKAGHTIFPRTKRWSEGWLNMIMKHYPNMPPERKAKVEQMLENAAQICEMEQGPGAAFIGRNKIGVKSDKSYLP